ncbi:hypothetical protein IJ101_02295 [Candidatus Saccharibacteria bacterium]|nr:hypothetical protein [Candidatus Saccharibacteria bacterium]
MKKTLIAGAASVALAAMPVVGAFAATSSQLIDTVNVTVQGGCTIENAAEGATPGDYTVNDRTFSKTIAAGTFEEITGTETEGSVTPAQAMKIKCNVAQSDSRKFSITAQGTALTHTDNSTTIPVGTATSGNTSAWAYTLNYTDDNPTWANAPVSQTTVVTSQDASTSTNYSFNPVYRVYVAPGQKPGAYTGTITYTVALDAVQQQP